MKPTDLISSLQEFGYRQKESIALQIPDTNHWAYISDSGAIGGYSIREDGNDVDLWMRTITGPNDMGGKLVFKFVDDELTHFFGYRDYGDTSNFWDSKVLNLEMPKTHSDVNEVIEGFLTAYCSLCGVSDVWKG